MEWHESLQQIVCCEKLIKPVHWSTAILTSGLANAGSTIIRRCNRDRKGKKPVWVMARV